MRIIDSHMHLGLPVIPKLELLERLKPGREKLRAILSGNALRLMENM